MNDLQSQLQKTLGNVYTLERELGGGGMARVFVARDQQLGRKVVVKTLANDSGVSVSAERFRREIRLAASLQQANIVPVHSAGDIDGIPYYTMPFVEGESLRAHLDARGALDARSTVNILRDVARALAYAHDRGVVHRDIKPENILLSGSTAVVTDFGIAKAIEASHSQAGTTLTQLGTLLGTPMYLSPEQAAGDPQVDHRADIYSLGIVAYEMLAGARPFTADGARALLAAHVHETPPPLATRCTGVPSRLLSLVMRCLEKDPARRPANAGELLDVLDDAADAIAVALAQSVKPSIAVLPFANLSPDAADEFFADGLTDEIITDLGSVHTLHVIARTAMMRYKGTEKEPAQVARELRVRYVLDGSVRRSGDSIRLTARLLDTETDATVWSDKLSSTVVDVFQMQEQVSRTIVGALKVTLTPREDLRLAERPIGDLRAYEAYLQAKQAMWSFGPDSLVRARRLIEAAHARVGEHPHLIAVLGFIAIHSISAGGANPRAEEATAEECARRLAELAPDSFVRFALAGLLHWRKGEIREAISTLSSAHEREPGNVDVVCYLQYACLMAGRDDRARELSERVVALDPVTPLMQAMPAFCDIMTGRAHHVLANYAELVAREPLNPLAHFWFLCIRAEAGDVAGMRESARELVQRWPDTEFGAVGAMATSLLDDPASAARLVVPPAVRALSAESESVARSLCWLFARLGAADPALDALEDAMRRGLAHYPHLARDSQSLASVRGTPRFQRLLAVARERWERGGTSATDLSAPAAADRKSVAVLPFANLSPDPENEFFAEGITDDLIAQVAKIGSLRVIARTSVMRFRGVPDAARLAAKDLRVNAVVEGTVRRAGKRARIVAQLIDAAADAPIWSETFDRDLDDIFSVQAEVATRVAQGLKASLTSSEERRLNRAATRDAKAYDLYLMGRQHYNRRTPESLKSAIAHFEQAIVRDDQFAGAYAGLADAYVFAGLGYAPIPVAKAFAKAKEAAARAVALDDTLPEALCAVGLSALHGDWNLQRAREVFERAASLNPNHAAAHQFLGWCAFAAGEYAAAVDPLHRARELDPLNVSLMVEEAWPYSYAGLHDIASDYYRRAIEVDPGFGLGHYNLGMCFERQGRPAEALACYERAIECMGPSPWMLANTATSSIALGNRARSEEVLATLHDLGRSGVAVWLSIAMILDALGRGDEAADALERAIDAHEPFVWALGLEGWLVFPNARRLPRFQRIFERVGARPHDVPRQRELLLQDLARRRA